MDGGAVVAQHKDIHREHRAVYAFVVLKLRFHIFRYGPQILNLY